MKHTAASYLDFIKKRPTEAHRPFHKQTSSVVPSNAVRESYTKCNHAPAAHQSPLRSTGGVSGLNNHSAIRSIVPGTATCIFPPFPVCSHAPKVDQHVANGDWFRP